MMHDSFMVKSKLRKEKKRWLFFPMQKPNSVLSYEKIKFNLV